MSRPVPSFRAFFRRPGVAAVAAVSLAVLSACVTDETAEAPPEKPPATVETASAPSARPAVEPAPAPMPEPVIPARPARVFPPFSSLIGAEGTKVLALIGRPRLRRAEAPAEIWLYRSAECALDLFLYAEPDGKARVAHAEVRPGFKSGDKGAYAPSPDGCLASVIRAFEAETGASG